MYDLAIIGAGWAGYNAALRAKQLNLKVVLIEKSLVGGVCLNSGCIPTKALIQSARLFNLTKKSSSFGIDHSEPRINFLKVQERKEKVIEGLRTGMQFMLKGVDFLNTEARLDSPTEINCGGKVIKTRNIIIATGSSSSKLSGLPFNHNRVVSSSEILGISELPSSLLIIGGGVIGCEFASLFSEFSVKVSIIEKTPHLIPSEDEEVAKKLEGLLRRKGINVLTGSDITNVRPDDYDMVLVSVGRTPDCTLPGIDKIGLKLENGKVVVDERLKTNIGNIYAAGDCTGKIMLAHYAGYQGRFAVDNIFGSSSLCENRDPVVPNCIFTDPEIASVGLNESEASRKRIDIDKYKFDFLGSGMARILDETQGFLKIITDRKKGTVLGASIIGPKATEIVGIMTLAVSRCLTVEQMRSILFAHPTLSESISEALK